MVLMVVPSAVGWVARCTLGARPLGGIGEVHPVSAAFPHMRASLLRMAVARARSSFDCMPQRSAVDLFWLPLGAGGHSVRLNGRAFEAVAARAARRPVCDLYHSALEVRVG